MPASQQRPFNVPVIIVTFKSAVLTIDNLRSIARERAGRKINITAIVVDNASGDLPSIADAVEKNQWATWVSLIPSPINGGFAYGNNLGIQHAFAHSSPHYLYLLNPDTQLRTNAINTLVDFMETHREAGIAGGSFENQDGTDWPISFRFPTLISELTQGLQINLITRIFRRWSVAKSMSAIEQPTDWICGAAMMIRPEVIAAIGGLDENYFLYYEETDFCFRAKSAGFSTWYVPKSRVMHIAGQSTGVTQRNVAAKRLPAYWFESRRRFFAISYGVRHAILIDLAAIASLPVGLAKALLLNRERVPHFIYDLIRHSLILSRNRRAFKLHLASPMRNDLKAIAAAAQIKTNYFP